MSQNLSVCSTIKLKFKHNNVIMKGYCRSQFMAQTQKYGVR